MLIDRAALRETLRDLINELESIDCMVLDDYPLDEIRDELQSQSGTIATVLEGWPCSE